MTVCTITDPAKICFEGDFSKISKIIFMYL